MHAFLPRKKVLESNAVLLHPVRLAIRKHTDS